MIAEALGSDEEDIFPEWMRYFVRPQKTRDPDKPKTIVNHKLARRIAENIPTDLEDSPQEYAAQSELADAFQKILKTLNYREREVLKLRYGLGTAYRNYERIIDVHRGLALTYAKIGEMFRVSRERVRQIESKALQRLQVPERKHRLRGFWEYMGVF